MSLGSHDGFFIVGRGRIICGLDVVGAVVLPGGAAQDGGQVRGARLLKLVGQLCGRVSAEMEI